MIKRFSKKVIDVVSRLFLRSQSLMVSKPVEQIALSLSYKQMHQNGASPLTFYGSDYAGASLLAFVKLAKEKGCRLVGTNGIATNAFFIREDISHSWLPEIEPSICFNHPRTQWGMKYRLPSVKDKQWIEV
jgi:hypothetical protein